jgi:tripartite-type tricarboxylate transporter receptor subunit TctC
MRIFTRFTQAVGAMLMAMPLAAGAAQPPAFPTKAVRIVTQFAAGASGDSTLRVLAPILQADFGQPVVIENRAGGGGVVSAEIVARSPADGYTVLAGTSATQVIRGVMVKNSTFDPIKDFTPVTALYTAITLLVAHPSVPVNSFAEVIDYAKRNPNKLSYGTSGIGTDHHLTGEQLRQITGAEMVHVPYKATAQALLDVVTGQIPLTFAITGAAGPFIKSGKIKVLGVVKEKRTSFMPDVPALNEAVPAYKAPANWTGIFGPANLPQPIVRRWHDAVVKALYHPDAQARWVANGYEVVGNTPEEFAATIKEQIALVAGIAKAAGIKPE